MWLVRIGPYVPSILTALAAVPLVWRAGVLYGVAAVALATASFLQVRRLMAETNGRNDGADEKDTSCAPQVFSTVDELSAGIAHEINNPLAIIMQETEWLQHLFNKDSSQDLAYINDCKDSLKEISHQVDRCREIVKKLLSLARQMNPVIQSLDLNSVLMTIMDLGRLEGNRQDINIVGDLAPELPLLRSDPPLLRQVFLNLLVNATHAVEKGGTVTITSRRVSEDFVEVSVKDNGCGIPPEHLSKIFTPFFSTKPEGKGTGLGLAMCRGIVERLGGAISVTSVPNKGTEFTVRLPLSGVGKGD